MSSTGKTQRLELNQWSENDPVMRVDFNADNQKLDDAIAAIPFVKLADVLTSSNAQQIDVRFPSSIDNYQALWVYASGVSISGNDQDARVLIRLQSMSGTVYSARNNITIASSDESTGSQSNYLSSLKAAAFEAGNNGSHFSVMWLHLVVDQSSADIADIVACEGRSMRQRASSLGEESLSLSHGAYIRRDSGYLPLSQIDTLNFVSATTGRLIRPGMRIKIYGLRA